MRIYKGRYDTAARAFALAVRRKRGTYEAGDRVTVSAVFAGVEVVTTATIAYIRDDFIHLDNNWVVDISEIKHAEG